MVQVDLPSTVGWEPRATGNIIVSTSVIITVHNFTHNAYNNIIIDALDLNVYPISGMALLSECIISMHSRVFST